jgi:NADPH-dependent 2,4-dienoyl-CoA reductase/sulfur reductase-like enzyme
MASHLETENSSLQHPASDGEGNVPQQTEILPADTVLIVGGGPVGLNLATVLAYYGVKSVVLERNETTTK